MARPMIRFKAIIPKKGFSFDNFAREIQNAMRDVVKPEIKELFEKTVDTWETKVDFRGTIRTIHGRSIRLLVEPYGSGKDLYALVARGSPPHPIAARNAPNLVFKEGYNAATTPYWIGSRKASRYGATRITPIVRHPGFPGRFWDVQISKDYESRFKDLMQEAVNRAAEMSNRDMRG